MQKIGRIFFSTIKLNSESCIGCGFFLQEFSKFSIDYLMIVGSAIACMRKTLVDDFMIITWRIPKVKNSCSKKMQPIQVSEFKIHNIKSDYSGSKLRTERFVKLWSNAYTWLASNANNSIFNQCLIKRKWYHHFVNILSPQWPLLMIYPDTKNRHNHHLKLVQIVDWYFWQTKR